ncbi:hypothetical protein VTK73DRAFT_10018 [Phialemonium thermophilum]|uniref:Uncharacterized protein n=1 Tax=Phialemonium thermophilum TaxID=223376 RepID=A0ABR3Y5L3_9PEZI
MVGKGRKSPSILAGFLYPVTLLYLDLENGTKDLIDCLGRPCQLRQGARVHVYPMVQVYLATPSVSLRYFRGSIEISGSASREPRDCKQTQTPPLGSGYATLGPFMSVFRTKAGTEVLPFKQQGE